MDSNKVLILCRKVIDGLIEYLLVFPIVLLIAAINLVASPFHLMVSIPLLFVLGMIFRGVVAGRKKAVYILFSLIMSAAFSYFISSVPSHWIILLPLSFISSYRGIYYGSVMAEDVNSTGFYWLIGFPIYFFAYFFFRFIPSLHPFLAVLTSAGILMVVGTLIIGNRKLLESSSLSNQKHEVPRSARSKNLVLISVSLLVIGIISAIHIIKQVIFQGFLGLMKGLLWVLSLLGSHTMAHETIKSNKTPLKLKAGEPSKFASMLDKIIHIVVIIGLILAGLWLLFFISKYLIKWVTIGFRWLMRTFNERFRSNLLESEEDLPYYDEKMSLINFKKWRESKKDQAKDAIRQWLKRQPNWESLNDDDKIRYAYRQVIKHHVKKGFLFYSSKTPSETIHEMSKTSALSKKELNTLSHVYDRVRYGSRLPEANELHAVSTLLTDMDENETSK